jgi:hypothetical protein
MRQLLNRRERCVFQLFPFNLCLQLIARGWNIYVVKRNGSQPFAAPQAVAFRQYNAPKPSWKCFRLAKLREFLPGGHECLLRRVFCEMKISQRSIRTRVSHILKGANKLTESFVLFGERGIAIQGLRY